MKKGYFTGKLGSAVFITILLLYFLMKTTSSKIIFVPFLICGVSMIGKNVALISGKKKWVRIFDKLFVAGFLLFWFGFLGVVGYTCVRDRNYSMLLFLLLFLLVGISVVRRRLLNVRSKDNTKSKFDFRIILGASLVIIALLAGVMLIVLGITQSNGVMIFAGAFFVLGSFTFVLAALTIQGHFDNLKIDVLGMYIGVLFVMIGIGVIMVKYVQLHSLLATIQAFDLWILIPVILAVTGVLQIVKCLRKKNEM